MAPLIDRVNSRQTHAGMPLGTWLRPCLDWMMRQMDELRALTVGLAEGDVLEIGFGTGLNLADYGPGVKSLVAVDPKANACAFSILIHPGIAPVLAV